MLMTMSISRAPSRIARRASSALISGGCAPSGKPTTQQTFTERAPQQRRRLPDVARVHADREEAVPARLVAELLDVGRRRLRLEQGVVDQARHPLQRHRRRAGRRARPAPAAAACTRSAMRGDVLGGQRAAQPGDGVLMRSSLHVPNHLHARPVAIGRAGGRQEDVDDAVGRVGRRLARAERQHVGVVVLAAVPRQRLVVAGGRQHAGHLVGRHRRADPGAVHHDAEVGTRPRRRAARRRARSSGSRRRPSRGSRSPGRRAPRPAGGP